MVRAKRRRAVSAAFKYVPPSVKGLKLMSWWMDHTPYNDYSGVIADGAIRSGKTVSALDGFTLWSLENFKYQDFIVAGKSMGALRRNVLKPWFALLKAKGIDYYHHKTEHWVQIGTNTYHLFGANNESSQDVLQGFTAAGSFFDEVPLMPQSFVEQAIGRCSVAGSKLWFTGNPEGPYHWFKLEYIDKAKEKGLLYLHFTIDDNPSLAKETKDRYKKMFTGVWFKRFILGLWTLAEGIVYSVFNEDRHVKREDLSDTRFDYFICGVDYGTSTVTVFGLYGIYRKNGQRCAHKIKEYYHDAGATKRQKTDSEFAADFKKFLIIDERVANDYTHLNAGEIIKPRKVYVDPSAASFKLELRKAKVQSVVSAKNEVVDGIRVVSRLLSEDRYTIDPACEHSVREMGSYSWDPKAGERGEDKPLKRDDHCSDETRYALRNHLRGAAGTGGVLLKKGTRRKKSKK